METMGIVVELACLVLATVWIAWWIGEKLDNLTAAIRSLKKED